MSIKFLARLQRELPELFSQLEQSEGKEFDEEVETISKMDCDVFFREIDTRTIRKNSRASTYEIGRASCRERVYVLV